MANSRRKERIINVENSLIQSTLESPLDVDTGRELKYEKRDKLTAHTSNLSKKISVDIAMEMSNDSKGEAEIESSNSDTIEGEVETVSPKYEDSVKTVTKPKKEDELSKKLAKYKDPITNNKIFNGLHLNDMQKKFVYYYCDPDSDFFQDKHRAYTAAGYTAKNKNSLVANISMNMKKPKIKEAMDRYRKQMIDGKKLEISTDMVNILRRRASYSVTTFFEFGKDGKKKQKPLDEIPEEWHCCIDNIKDGYQTSKGIYVAEYILCDRAKSMDQLNKLLEIQQSISTTPVNKGGRPPNSVTAAVDMGKDKDGNQGPRVVINMSLFEDD